MNRSDNEILFQCEADILNEKKEYHLDVYRFISDWNINKGREINNNFSHDNWTGVYCWVNMFNKNLIEDLPLFGHHALRPDNFCFYFYAKYKWIGWIFLPIISLSMIISMLRVWRKGKNGEQYIDTDGKLLAFFKCKSFNFRITKWILDFIISKHKDLSGWSTIFDIYYEYNHIVWIAFIDHMERERKKNI